MAPRWTFSHARDATDLAAIVLAEPEPRPVRMHGYDARSVLLLLLVVASLAAVLAGMMSLRSGSGGSADAPVTARPSALASLDDEPVADAATATTSLADTIAPDGASTLRTAPAGIALGVGRITATPDPARGSLVIRVAVANAGTNALVAATGARLVVLIDDQVIGTTPLGTLAARRGRVVAAVSTYACVPGRHVVTAIADATSRVSHAAGSNVARSVELTVTCP